MGLRQQLFPQTGLEGAVEASNQFRQAMQANQEQKLKMDQLEKMRLLAQQAPEMLGQPGGEMQFASQMAEAGDPEMLRRIAAGQAQYAMEQKQGLNPSQLSTLGIDEQGSQAFTGATLEQQKLLLDQRQKEKAAKLDLEKFYLKKAADDAKKELDKKSGKAFTAAQFQAGQYFTLADKGNQQLANIMMDAPDLVSRTSTSQLYRMFKAPQAVRDEKLKRYMTSVESFIVPILRKQSGAAISESEFERAWNQYIPQPGDSPQVLAQKLEQRSAALAGLEAEGGESIDLINEKFQQQKTKGDASLQKRKFDTLAKKITAIKNPELRKEAEAILQEAMSGNQDVSDELLRELNALIK